MEEIKERNFVCKYCDKQFPSGKSLGGHIRIHTNENSVDSDRFNGNMNKRLVDHQREILALKQQQQQQQHCCTECGREFVTLKAYRIHMTCHSKKEKMLMDSQSDTETYSAPTRKRSKRVAMKQSNSESFSNGNSSVTTSEINQEVINGALNLMRFSRDTSFKKGHKLVMMNSLGELSDKNSVIVETKSSSGEVLKIPDVKNEVLETDKVAVVDELRSADDNGVILYDSDGSDVDYFMNGPKKSDSGFSVDRSLRNNGFASQFNKRFRSSDEKGSKYELSRSKRVPSYETDSCADTNNKVHRFSDIKTAMVKKAGDEKKKSKGHKCPICFRVFKSGQALGGHKRSHNQEHNQIAEMRNQIAEMRNQIDLNLPCSDTDE